MSNLVSVIVPNYNHAQYLDIRLKSILAQTYTDFEIIILDDNSIDNYCCPIKTQNHVLGSVTCSK